MRSTPRYHISKEKTVTGIAANSTANQARPLNDCQDSDHISAPLKTSRPRVPGTADQAVTQSPECFFSSGMTMIG